MKRCENCGKLYHEDDLNKCLCGGKLIMVQSFIGHITDEMDAINELDIESRYVDVQVEDKHRGKAKTAKKISKKEKD